MTFTIDEIKKLLETEQVNGNSDLGWLLQVMGLMEKGE